MKKLLYTLSITICIFSCNQGNRDKLSFKEKISENLYEEVFIKEGGVWAGNTYYYFYTDSLNFRCYAGIGDDDEKIFFKVINDTLFISKFNRRSDTLNAIETSNKSIKDLTSLKNYE